MYDTADIAENLIIQNHSQSSLFQLCSKQNVKQKLLVKSHKHTQSLMAAWPTI